MRWLAIELLFGKEVTAKTGQAYAESVALFHILKGENPDFFGWLSIPDTLLDYPVIYTPCDPGYYLRRAFDGDESVSGVPFVGAGYQQNSRHIIIYGHNMKNGNYVYPPCCLTRNRISGRRIQPSHWKLWTAGAAIRWWVRSIRRHIPKSKLTCSAFVSAVTCASRKPLRTTLRNAEYIAYLGYPYSGGRVCGCDLL